MDPYPQHLPHLRVPSSSPYHYNPNWEPGPHHMKADTFKHAPSYEPWPYTGTAENNCCYNHGYPPGYYDTRPPYFHFQPPPQMYYHPSYPPYAPYPGPYPPYVIPPHYAADHARFDYDKERYHCCGCPNHVCHKQEGSSVRIEEEKTTPKSKEEKSTLKIVEEPEKGSKNSHNSLIRFPGSHYPFQRLPCNRTREGSSEKYSQSFPKLSFNDNMKGLDPGHVNTTFHGDDKFSQMPYPIYWLPGNEKPEDPVKDKKEIDATSKSTDWPSRFRGSQLKLLDNVNSDEKSKVVEEEPNIRNSLDRVVEKERKIRTIPVVHLGSGNEKISMPEKSNEHDKLNKNVAGEMSDTSMKKESSKKNPSPSKTSKLPPVCLRVDPLPKKNGSNAKARIPNPPGFVEKGKVNKDNTDQVVTNIKKVQDNAPPKVIEVIDVKSQPSAEEVNGTSIAIASGQDKKDIVEKCSYKENKDGTSDVDVQVKGDVFQNKEEANDIFSDSQQSKIELEKEKADSTNNKMRNNKMARTNLPPEEAALRIQSAYRGFNVRKYQPLEKLKKIKYIHEKVADVKNKIQKCEDSSELDVKQKVVISETIMDLLLQLDAVQALLPSLREVRKSVARELVFLQDKLDELYNQAMNEHEEGTRKKDECCSSVAEAMSPASVSHMNEDSLINQPSPSLNEENFSVPEIDASSMAFECEPVVFDKTTSALELDKKKEEGDVLPGTKIDQAAMQDKCMNDMQADNLLSIVGEANMIEMPVSENVVSFCHVGAVANSDLKQSEEDQGSNFLFKQQNEEDQESNHTELLVNEAKFDPMSDARKVLAVKPDEENRLSLFEGGVLKEKMMCSENGSNMDEDLTIKPEEVIGERNDEAIMNERNIDVSEEMKTAFVLADEAGGLESCRHEPGLLSAMNPNQTADVVDADKRISLSFKDFNETDQSTEGESCVESVDRQNRPEISSGISTTEIVFAAKDLGDVGSRELTMDNNTDLQPNSPSETGECGNKNEHSISLEDAVCDGHLKDNNNDEIVVSATSSINEIVNAANAIDSTPETHPSKEYDKSFSRDSYNDELNSKEKKFMEENAELRLMLKTLLHAGQEQMGVISSLNDRVKNLERRLMKKKKVKASHNKLSKPSGSPVSKGRGLSSEEAVGSAI